MIAELLSVGTELLMGQVLNTNAQYISQKLAEYGVNVFHQVTVGDNPGRLRDAVRTALSRADMIILTGGLGPTGDDLTKETVADALGLKMQMNEQALEHLRAQFAKYNRTMTPNNEKQAVFPVGCIILPNHKGTAPGCIVENEGKTAVLLPGPPREMTPMFNESVLPYLEERSGCRLLSHEIRIYGKGESDVEYELRDMMENQTNPTIAPYAKTGEVTLRLTAKCQTLEEGEQLIRPMIDEIKRRFGDKVYSTDGETLERVCARLLCEQKKTLAVAESCTGGLVASTLISVPGSSAFFAEGCVTYSNEAKTRRLNVPAELIEKYGAVSEECAKAMAEGMRLSSGADIAVATTGIAGPSGGTPEKPVGLVYFAVSTPEGTKARKVQFFGDRERVRLMATLSALDTIRRTLLKL